MTDRPLRPGDESSAPLGGDHPGTDHLGTQPLGTEPLGTDDASVTRYEERADVGTEMQEAGRVRVRKHVETFPVEQSVSRSIEHADTSERLPAVEGDSGEVETLEDGSVSIPVFEEVLVVTKKLVVRERVIVRKHTVVDEHTLQTELRREHVTVDADDDVVVRDDGVDDPHRPTAP